MRVLMLNPPYLRGFMRNARWEAFSIAGSEWLPIWLAYATGWLEKHGHDVRLLDAGIEKLSKERTFQIIKEFKPELTAVYVTTTSMENDLEVANMIKEAGSEVVLVGPWCSIYPENILKKSGKVSMLVDGEFDFPVLDLADGKPAEKIHGLVWKDDSGKIRHNGGDTSVPKNRLDEFPFVSDVYRRHIDLRKYHQAAHLHPFIDIFTGRGCAWGKCTFCLWPFTICKNSQYRTRSMENVIDEIKFIRKELPWVREIFIQDDTLPAWRAKELSEAILKSGLKVTWSCYARADASMDYGTLSIMKKAGCRIMHVGYESSDPGILKSIIKGTTVKTMEDFTKAANELNLMIHADFIVGLPGETEETIKNTVSWARKLKVHSYQFTVPKPYPGTPFYSLLEKNGWLKDGYADYPNLSHEEIVKWNKWALKQTNMSSNYIMRMLVRPREWPRLARTARYTIPYIFSK
ncbi:MAG: radical SAM protein [Candidatus Aenigmarchaeota archaeon]|nr:radical SAM protein [Candidatus Aenigmarchaeota archaeon]